MMMRTNERLTGHDIAKMVNRLYGAVAQSGWSAHIWHDEDWSNLYRIREICNEVLPVGFRLIRQEVFGYDANNMTKRYLFVVEHEDTGERIIDAYINAHAAGRVDDVWSGYDCTATFSRHYE